MDNAIKIRACRDGHFVSLRSVAEMEVLHHEQSPPTRPTKRNSKGVSRTAEVKQRFSPKTLSSAQFTADKQAAAFAEEAARNAAARASGSAPPPAAVQEADNGEDGAPAARDDAPAAREKQPEYMLKLSFDTRRSSELICFLNTSERHQSDSIMCRVSRKTCHTDSEVMLLLIPYGEEGQRICQSAIRIRTIMIF